MRTLLYVSRIVSGCPCVLPSVKLSALVLLTMICLAACQEGADEGAGVPSPTTHPPTASPSGGGPAIDAATQPSADSTASPTPAMPARELLLTASLRYQPAGRALMEDGTVLTITISRDGLLFGLSPGDPWKVVGSSGEVLLSGEVIGDVSQYERWAGFVRLDDGNVIVHATDVDGGWNVYSAESECAFASYWLGRVSEDNIIFQGMKDTVRFCRESLGLLPK